MRGRAGKATWLAWRSIRNPSLHPVTVKHFSTNRPFFPLGASTPSATTKGSTMESVDAFEHRIFQGGASGNETYNSREDAFFEKLDRLKNARQQWDVLNEDDDDSADAPDGIPEGLYLKFKQSAVDYDFYDDKGEGWVLSDKLMPYRADAELYEFSQEVDEEFYDLTKPPSYANAERGQFTVTTAEVLAKADFRNVRFLANFITDAGIIIKRSQTGISAKAQRKVAREIKTARAFGLMPFTTMGTKSFVFGRTMEGLDEDFEYERFDGPMGAGAINDERLGA